MYYTAVASKCPCFEIPIFLGSFKPIHLSIYFRRSHVSCKSHLFGEQAPHSMKALVHSPSYFSYIYIYVYISIYVSVCICICLCLCLCLCPRPCLCLCLRICMCICIYRHLIHMFVWVHVYVYTHAHNEKGMRATKGPTIKMLEAALTKAYLLGVRGSWSSSAALPWTSAPGTTRPLVVQRLLPQMSYSQWYG